MRQSEVKTKKPERITTVWRNGGFSAPYDSFVVGSSVVLRLNICAKNPPLRQTAKRYQQGEEKTATLKMIAKWFENEK